MRSEVGGMDHLKGLPGNPVSLSIWVRDLGPTTLSLTERKVGDRTHGRDGPSSYQHKKYTKIININ